jgi:phospholipase/carboxylesterase
MTNDLVPSTFLSRRDFCALVTSFAFGSLSACRLTDGSAISNGGRVSARPHQGVKATAAGRIPLGLDLNRDAILHLPKSESPLPLLVMLHGATQNAEDMFWYLGSAHEEAGVAVLAPNSRDTTWDAIRGSFGPDVDFLNRSLERVFQTAAIDPARICVGGFSDGASYAIGLGLLNTDLFTSVAAFSPGFVPEEGASQADLLAATKPRFFISHGTHDHILPINSCGRRIAQALEGRGYDVTFREFDGDHEIPADIAREGMRWISTKRS